MKSFHLWDVLYYEPSNDLSFKIFYRMIKDGFCLTFHHGDNYYIKEFHSIYYKRWTLIIHQANFPSHFERQNLL